MQHAAPSSFSSIPSHHSRDEHRSRKLKKSPGEFFRPRPANYEEHVRRAIRRHIEQHPSIEKAAEDIGRTEKTARNWRDKLPPNQMGFVKFLKKHPELREEIFNEWSEA